MSKNVNKIIIGALWVFATRWVSRAIGLISIIILARLLVPEDYGLVALAATYVSIITGISSFDVNKALIHFRETEKSLYDSAWTLSVIRGVLSFVIMVSSAPLIASFMDDSRLESIIYVLSVQPLLQGFSNPKFTTFEKNMVFSKQSYIIFSERVASFFVTITIAYMYQSYWALIIGTIIASLVKFSLSYFFIPYRPSFSFKKAKKIFSFSGWMSLSTIISTISLRIDNFVIGRVLGISETGIYYMTRQIGEMPTQELLTPIHAVLFPSFSEFSNNKPQLRRIALETISITASIGLPVSIGFALIANNFVPLVLGEKWLGIVNLLQVLVPVFGFQAIFSTSKPIVMALGATRELFINSLLYSLVRVPIFISSIILWGLNGVIWALLGAGTFFCLLQYRLLYTTLNIKFSQVINGIIRPITATLVLVITVLSTENFLLTTSFALSPALLLFTKVIVGGISYAAIHYGVWVLSNKPSGIESRLIQLLSKG